MSRTRPKNRLANLVECAADVFIRSKGYKRTQMDEIASRLGVSKGTLYLYVEGKEALFDLALRFADRPETFQEPEQLPVRTPEPGTTVDYIHTRLASDESILAFAFLAAAPHCEDPENELENLVRALYRALHVNRRAIKLVDTCAADHPELVEMWYESGRGGITSLLVPFLQSRIDAGHFSPVPDVELAARYVLESCMLWAIHLHWDPHPETLNHDQIEETVVHFVVRGLQERT